MAKLGPAVTHEPNPPTVENTKDFQIEIVNEIYGLDVNIPKEHMILDKTTGLNQNGTAEVQR